MWKFLAQVVAAIAADQAVKYGVNKWQSRKNNQNPSQSLSSGAGAFKSQ